MSVFLAVILERIDTVNNLLQKEMIELKAAVNLLKLLAVRFLTSQRDLLKNTKRRQTRKLKHDTLTTFIICASENGIITMVTRKKLYTSWKRQVHD